jgi:putative DNA primase/helicase
MAKYPRTTEDIVAEVRGEKRATGNEKGFTDYGNAERLVERYGDDVRYCRQTKLWYIWDGKRWAPDTTGRIERCAKDTVRNIYREAADIDDAALRKSTAKWARASESRRRLTDMVVIAETETVVAVERDLFDGDPWYFGCLNGVLNTRTGELLPHDRKYFITKLAPVEYDPDATFDMWDEFLETATQGNAEIQGFLRRAMGCALTAQPADDDRFFFIHGPPGGGKSTFIEAVKGAWGDYARTANFDTFMTHYNAGSARSDLARLNDARLVTSIEIPEGKKVDEAALAALTGGDTITARFHYRGEFEFHPRFKLFIAGNNEPVIQNRDSPLWRRLLKIPFEHIIDEGVRDEKVKLTLRDDPRAHAAVLAWAMRGCLEWQRTGLAAPDAVRVATAEYRTEQDEIGGFISERCVLRRGTEMERDEAYADFKDWCHEAGIQRPITRTAFVRRLKARFQCQVKGPRRIFIGVGLLTKPQQSNLNEDDDENPETVF